MQSNDSAARMEGGDTIQRRVGGSWGVGEVVGPESNLLENQFNSFANPRSVDTVAPPFSLRLPETLFMFFQTTTYQAIPPSSF